MEINPWLLVIIGVLSAGAGYVFHMLDSRVTNVLKEGREKAVGDQEPKPVQKVDEHSVLRVTLDQALKWHLQLDGVQIEPDALTPEQRARLVNVIVQIRPWIDGKTAAPVAPATPPPATSLSGPQVASTPLVTQPAAPATPRLDVARGFRTMWENEIKKPEPPKAPSIVGMIDEVLQKKLASSPLASKRIRLEEGAIGEVIVFVGMTRYSGVDEVPDEEIKAIIRAAIADWNNTR